MRDRAVWPAHRVHIPEVGGSNPSPAKENKDDTHLLVQDSSDWNP